MTHRSTVRLGVIGTGSWGTNGHLTAYQQSPYVQVVAACDVSPANLARAAERFQIPATFDDYQALLSLDGLDAVDVSTPNVTHAEVSLAAIERGLAVLCEKPLGMNRRETRIMAAAARAAGRHTAVNFTYRNVPAARFIQEIVQAGEIGEIHHIIATYNQGHLINPESPLAWRMQKHLSGTGVLGDLGSHLIDLARFWGLEFQSVLGHLKTLVADRPHPDGRGRGVVDVDDAASFLAEFTNGATGTFFCTRFAFARANTQRIELYGSKGGLVYENERPNEIQFAAGSLMARQRHYATMPVPARIVDSRTTTMQLFVSDLVHGQTSTATFDDGAACQEILDAVESAAQTGTWARVPLD
jgi:predicted dehydrogenase